MPRISIGKVPINVLEKIVLPYLGASSSDVVVRPSVGVDFAAIRFDRRYLIVASDPVTGVKERVGWYAANVSANDVATSGARPRFLQSVILLPEGADTRILKDIVMHVHRAAKSLRMTVVGGHTESTPGLDRCIVITTAFGFTDRFVTAADAQEGDAILMTKSAAIEGTAILAATKKGACSSPLVTERMTKLLSVVGEAQAAFKTGRVHAMHDPTEGGVVGGVCEMATASGLGFEIFEEAIPVAEETLELCGALKVDPLKLISSGALLIALKPPHVKEVSEALRGVGVRAASIGSFKDKRRVLVRRDGREEEVVGKAVVDELWRLLSSKSL